MRRPGVTTMHVDTSRSPRTPPPLVNKFEFWIWWMGSAGIHLDDSTGTLSGHFSPSSSQDKSDVHSPFPTASIRKPTGSILRHLFTQNSEKKNTSKRRGRKHTDPHGRSEEGTLATLLLYIPHSHPLNHTDTDIEWQLTGCQSIVSLPVRPYCSNMRSAKAN